MLAIYSNRLFYSYFPATDCLALAVYCYGVEWPKENWNWAQSILSVFLNNISRFISRWLLNFQSLRIHCIGNCALLCYLFWLVLCSQFALAMIDSWMLNSFECRTKNDSNIIWLIWRQFSRLNVENAIIDKLAMTTPVIYDQNLYNSLRWLLD